MNSIDTHNYINGTINGLINRGSGGSRNTMNYYINEPHLLNLRVDAVLEQVGNPPVNNAVCMESGRLISDLTNRISGLRLRYLLLKELSYKILTIGQDVMPIAVVHNIVDIISDVRNFDFLEADKQFIRRFVSYAETLTLPELSYLYRMLTDLNL